MRENNMTAVDSHLSVQLFEGKAAKQQQSTKSTTKSLKKLTGILLAIISALFLTIGAVIIKYVDDVSVGEMSLYRYVVLLAFSAPLLLKSKNANWLGEPNWNWRMWMLVRSLAGFTNLFCNYSAVKYISLADTTIICLWTPVVVFIFARLILKEPFGRWHIVALVLSSIGVALASKIHIYIINGTLFSSRTHTGDSTQSSSSSPHHRIIGIAYCLSSVCMASIVLISLRKIRQTHHFVLLFHFSIIAIIETSIINWLFFQFRFPTTGYTPYLMILLGVCAFFGQLFLTKATKLEEAGVVSVVRSSSGVVFAFVFQLVMFNEAIDYYSIGEAILVIGSIILLSFRKYIIALPDEAAFKAKFKFLI